MLILFAKEFSLRVFILLRVRLIKRLRCSLLKHSFPLFRRSRCREVFFSFITLECFSKELILIVFEIRFFSQFLSYFWRFSTLWILCSLIKLVYINFWPSTLFPVKCISVFCQCILIKRLMKFNMRLLFFWRPFLWNSISFRRAA